MLYTARVLSDCRTSSAIGNRRVTTIEVTFPRFILAEVNTHRVLSRNSASSRAIPTEKLITNVKQSPFVPLKFNKRVKGMGVGDELNKDASKASLDAWLWARDQAVKAAEILVEQDVDKSRANRLLEPFMEHTAIITGMEWDNFFALRYHKHAQPEFELTARVMLKAMLESDPRELEPGGWSMPMVDPEELHKTAIFGDTDWMGEVWPGQDTWDLIWPLISASRCARVSYDTHENFEEVARSVERAGMLVGNGHLSPFEHVVKAPTASELLDLQRLGGNLPGFVQLRKIIPYDWNRVGHLEGRMSWEEMEIPEIPELVAA
jgi:thymidylate synthase ThyX